MKKVLFFSVSLFIGTGLLVWIIRFVGWEEIESSFKFFSPWAGAAILFLTILANLTRAWRWKTILRDQGYDIPVFRTLEYYLSGNAIGFFMPMVIFGGEIFRGYDLKEKYAMPWSKSIASVVIDRISEFTIYAVVTILGIAFFIANANIPSYKTGITVFSGFFLIIASIGFFYFKSFKKESIIRFFLKKFNAKNSDGAETAIETEKEIFRYFKPKKKIMWQGFGLSFLLELILLTRTFLLILFLGKNISIFSAVSVVAFSSLALVLPIPAALGSHDAVQSFVFTALGLGAGTGAAFVLVIRGAELIAAMIGLFFFFKFGVQFLQSFLLKKIGRLVNHRNYLHNKNKHNGIGS